MFTRIAFTRTAARSLGLGLLGACLLFSVADSGWGGKPLGSKTLKAEFNAPGVFQKRLDLISGVRQPSGAEDQKLIDVMARFFVYRVTWLSSKAPGEMEKIHVELERNLISQVLGSGNAKGNKVFVEQLGKELAKRLEEVLALDFTENRTAVLNGALMLPPIAKMRQEYVGDLLAKLLQDPKRHDAVKLYAAKALREFFPARVLTVNDDPKDSRVKDKFKRDTERLNALVGFISRPGPAKADEGERDAMRFMRREAIISLANIGVPALSALKKSGEVTGPAAYALLRMLVKGKGAYTPPTALAERVEAAIGLCHLKGPERDTDYDPSVAVYAVGLTFHDFAKSYQEDFVNLAQRKDLKNPKHESKLPTMHWRVQSERFKYAMQDLVGQAKGTPAQANAQTLSKAVALTATTIAGYGSVAGDLGPLRKTVDALKPQAAKTNGQLYKLKLKAYPPSMWIAWAQPPATRAKAPAARPGEKRCPGPLHTFHLSMLFALGQGFRYLFQRAARLIHG